MDIDLYHISPQQATYFLSKPESGMGYQILINPQQNEELLITNSEFISDFDQPHDEPVIVDFSVSKVQLKSFKNEDLSQLDNYQVKVNSRYKDKEVLTPIISRPFIYITRQGDEFRRLSAFRNDRRILQNGSILPGTYGTSLSDLRVVPSGIAAVGRYALPNRIAACYIYQIIPNPGTILCFGTVTPNYGLCGGGVEVYFPNGCSEGSARLIGTLSEI